MALMFLVKGNLTPRWMCWFISMIIFLNLVYVFLGDLAAATVIEAVPVLAS